MSFENGFKSNERYIRRISAEDFKIVHTPVSSEVVDTPEFRQEMADRGIEVSDTPGATQMLDVEGHEVEIVTFKGDFGTVVNELDEATKEALGLNSGTNHEFEAFLSEADPNLVEQIDAEKRADEVRGHVVNGIKKYFGFGG